MFHSQSEFGTDETRGRTFRLTVAYDGTDFFGWQVQPGLATIQGTLATCIHQITGEAVLPQGSGRTDTGVHAQAQVVSLVLQGGIPTDRLQQALNRRLPSSIRVLSLSEAASGFHARSGVTNKTYEYRIFERGSSGAAERVCPPQLARYVWDYRWPSQVEAMQQAADALAGTHDFTSFAAINPDRSRRIAQSPATNNIRTVFSSEWRRRDGLLVYRITGSGFLHHMVRNIVGTCVDAGAGRLDPGTVPVILAAQDRRKAGATAPPQGLHLVEVVYEDDPPSGGPA